MAAPRLDLLPRFLRRVARGPARALPRDEELLTRFTAGRDEQAFAELVRRHGPMVLGVCRRLLGDDHLAEDAFQATFLVLARKAATITRPAALPGWLHRVARHAALRARSQFPPQGTVPLRCDDMPTQDATPACDPDLRAVLDEEIAHLPEKYRGPVILCYLQGRSYAEAAGELGCPPGTVSGRLARARQRLHGRLLRRGVTLSAAALAGLGSERAIAATLAQTTTRGATAGIVSARAAALADGVLRSMKWFPLTLLAVTLLAVAGITAAAALDRDAAPQPATPGSAQPPAVAEGTKENPVKPIWTDVFPTQGFLHARLSFAADGKTLFLCEGNRLRSWDLPARKQWQPWSKIAWHFGTPVQDGILISAYWADKNSHFVVLDAATGKTVRTFEGKFAENIWLNQFALSNDGKLFAVGEMDFDNKIAQVRVWQTATGKELKPWTAADGVDATHVMRIAISGETMAHGALNSHDVDLFDLAQHKRLHHLAAPREPHMGDDIPLGWQKRPVGVTALTFSPDGKRIAAGNNDGGIDVWTPAQLKDHPDLARLRLGSKSRPLTDLKVRGVGDLRFSKGGKSLFALDTVEGHGDRKLRRWDLATGKEMPLPVTSAKVQAFTLSPDESLLAILVPDQKLDARLELWPLAK